MRTRFQAGGVRLTTTRSSTAAEAEARSASVDKVEVPSGSRARADRPESMAHSGLMSWHPLIDTERTGSARPVPQRDPLFGDDGGSSGGGDFIELIQQFYSSHKGLAFSANRLARIRAHIPATVES